MSCFQGEPRLLDALSDPIVQALMAADGVDPEALHANLRQTATKVARRGTDTPKSSVGY